MHIFQSNILLFFGETTTSFKGGGLIWEWTKLEYDVENILTVFNRIKSLF